MEKIIKAGTLVRLKSSCTYAGCDSEDEYLLEEDMTESQLNEFAYEYALEQIQPEGYFEVIDESKEEE